MYHKHHTRGVVIGGVSDGVSDRRVSIFTEDMGLVWAKVQSARSSISKLRNHCQDFTRGEFSLVHGKTGWRVVSIRAEDNLFELVKEATDKVRILGNVFVLLRRLLTGEEPNKPLFYTVDNFLSFLVGAESSQLTIVEPLIIAKILYHLGFLKDDPELADLIAEPDMTFGNLASLAPKRVSMIHLINESLKAAEIGS